MLGDLDSGHTDAAAGAEDEHALPWLQLSAFDQGMPCGRSRGFPARAFGEGKSRGKGRNGVCSHDPLFSQRAPLAAGHDAITGPHALYIGSDLDHFS